MCGRFALTLPHGAVAEMFDAAPDPSLMMRGPRYNICPTQEVEVCRIGADKPAFRDAVRHQRCLIPASGFYEWRQSAGKGKEPYWISPASGAAMLAWAGIWQDWSGDDGQILSTCAIVTTAATGPLAPIHHRAPLAIEPGDFGLWLGEEGKGAARLMQPAATDYFAFHQVDTAINKAKADGPQLMASVSESRLL